MKYSIAIFSYNRSQYLKNCIDSVKKHCPTVKFTVYDDGSDEPPLLEYLKSLGDNVRHMKAAENSRHGGFYHNMQAALDEARTDYLLLLQDDVQLVRDVTERDISTWQDYWLKYDTCAFLNPTFMKGGRRKDFSRYYRPDPDERVYHWVEDKAKPSKDGPVPRFYMDVCLLNVGRLKARAWKFQGSELLNGIQAGEIFDHGMPQLADPFVFYVPEEPVYRSRVKTRGTMIAQIMAGNTVKCFVSMSAEDTRRMSHRDLSFYPFAEDFIHTHDPSVKRPYRFNVYRTNPLARLINKLEKIWHK